jgi:hypothetical protein
MGELGKRSDVEIEHEIQRARSDLLDHVDALRGAVERELDWRVHVVRNPLRSIGAAFFIGLLLGLR